MKFYILMENISKNENFLSEHGLSILVKTDKYSILSDTGQTGDFIKNAKFLNLNLENVDFTFISHGHFDHTGGLFQFRKLNQNPIYISKYAMNNYISNSKDFNKYIGMEEKDKNIKGFTFLDFNENNEMFKVNDQVSIFGNVTKRELWPTGNLKILENKDGKIIQDKFLHEMNLVINEGDKKALISGCCHCGIVNILEKYQSLYKTKPDLVISGFHMFSKTNIYTKDMIKNMEDTGNYLKENYPKTKFYTCHCTGEYPFDIMKGIMKDQLDYAKSGDIIDF